MPQKPKLNYWTRLARPKKISTEGSGVFMGTGVCNVCPLHKEVPKRKVAFCLGRGSLLSQVLFVGEAPGETEERRGIPFVGKAGLTLVEMLQEAEWDASYMVTNAVCCRPPDNRTPKVSEWRACSSVYLHRTIRRHAPRLIVCFGLIALKAVTGDSSIKLKNARRKVFEITARTRARPGAQLTKLKDRKIPVVCTYHPAYVLRDPTKRYIVVEDLRHFMRLLSGKQLTEEPKSRTYIHQLEGEDLPWNFSAAHSVAVDLETTGYSPFEADSKIRVVGLSQAPMHATSFPLLDDMNADRLKKLLDDDTKTKVGHNLKFDLLWLKKMGFEARGELFDTLTAFHLIDENYPDRRLRHLAARFTPMAVAPDDKDVSATASMERLLKEVCIDADATYRLYRLFEHRLHTEGLTKVFEMLMATLRTLVDVEYAGIRIDQEKLDERAVQLKERRAKINRWLENNVPTFGTARFNPASTVQVRKLLYERFKLPVTRRTGKKKRPSTDELALRTAMARTDDAMQVKTIKGILELRDNTLRTYVTPMREQHLKVDGMIHPTYNLAIAVTGRLSSDGPNFQNFPPSMRDIVISRFGDEGTIVSCDFSQMELRVLAHCSQEPALIHAFEEGQDIHARTASEIFNKKLKLISDKERYLAKTVNFSIVYGATAPTIASTTGMSVPEAQALIERYMSRLPGVARWIRRTKREFLRTGVVTTLFGRKRRLPIVDPDTREGARILRQIVNFMIQSPASDINLVCMNEIHGILKQGMESRIIGTVHDSIVVDCLNSEVDEVMMTMEKVCDNPPTESFGFTLSVPLKVDLSFGPSWGEQTKLPKG